MRPDILCAAGVAAAWLCACARAPSAEDRPPPPPSVAPAPVAPVDHLAPGELVEGTEHAFGLTLPSDLRIDRSFAQVVYATGEVGMHPLAKYFRARLQGGALDEEDTSATLTHVRVPSVPQRELYIRIAPAIGSRVRAEIRDSTPPPAPDLPDEAARWRNVGLTPQGKVLEPVHTN
jgi:hypothetical protein